MYKDIISNLASGFSNTRYFVKEMIKLLIFNKGVHVKEENKA